MVTSKKGIDLIKSFEGLRLKAYKAVATEKYYTIGYGHYGSDVKSDMVINEKDAEMLLIKDLHKFEEAVNKHNSVYNFSQNEFDALVSFTYNCGAGNLTKLTASDTRTKQVIAEKMLSYNKSGGNVLAGLTNRRKKEQELFLSSECLVNQTYFKKYTGSSNSVDIIFKAIGVAPSMYGNYIRRKPIAEANGISNYVGAYGQNVTLVKLAKEGKLVKPKEV